MDEEFVIGIDLGGTKIATGLADKGGNLLHRVIAPTGVSEGSETVVRNIEDTVDRVLAEHGTDVSALRGIGVCSPGPIDPERGIILNAHNVGLVDVGIVDHLRNRFGVPTYLENDANAAALGEYRFGAGRGARHLCYITASTGIGGGVVADGAIYHGAHCSAGEIGHIIVMPDGPRCGCGQVGCLEALSAGVGIARRTVEAIESGRASMMREFVEDDPDRVNVQVVAQAASAGDALAREVLDTAWKYLSVGIITLGTLFDPEIVVIGGGISKLGNEFFDPVRAQVKERSGFLLHELPIIPAELGDDVGVLGAVSIVPSIVG